MRELFFLGVNDWLWCQTTQSDSNVVEARNTFHTSFETGMNVVHWQPTPKVVSILRLGNMKRDVLAFAENARHDHFLSCGLHDTNIFVGNLTSSAIRMRRYDV